MSKDAPNTTKVAQDVPPSKQLQQDVQLPGSAKPNGAGYKPKEYINRREGVQVGPGETWHDLTLDERIAHMRRHENKWRDRFAQEADKVGTSGNMNWTRG